MTDDGPGPGGGSGRDDGAPDARLAAAVAAADGSPATYGEVLAALATARVFLALSAQALGTTGSTVAPGLRQESAAQMQLLSLVSSRGSRALPAFLDGHQVQRWRPEARPVPVPGPQACRTVLEDGAAALLLDPVGRALAVAGTALVELAGGRVPVPGAGLSTRAVEAQLVAGAAAAPALLTALGRALAGEPVTAARLLQGPDGPVLGLVPEPASGAAQLAATPAALAALAQRVRLRLGPDLPATGLDLALVPADGPGQPVPLPVPRRARRPWRR